MKHYRIITDTPYGHKAGEIVSDLRLPRHEVPGWVTVGMVEEIDGESVQVVVAPAPPVPLELAPLSPVSLTPDTASIDNSASPTPEPR